MTAAFMAVLLSSCGIVANPLAGTHDINKQPGFKGAVDNPRFIHTRCLKQDGYKVHPFRETYGATKLRLFALQVGKLPSGPTVVFYPTPGAAQFIQMAGQAQGAEAVGAALIYPNQTRPTELAAVKSCVAMNVAG